jgi:hypothetical protein
LELETKEIAMHIGPATHEHRASARVYTYEGAYEVRDGEITWQATVTSGDEAPRELSGTVPLASDAAATFAAEAVLDAIVRRIDSFPGSSAL